jgi:phospholipid/cholesterol/gamma-HCH transport system permease protein
MKGNDEISALQTTGIDPVEFLVLPRVLALMIAMPLLVVFADFIGILGGLALGTLMLHLDSLAYYTQTRGAIGITDLVIGLIKSVFFGTILGIIGCWCGLRAERHAQGVGNATTKAVVLCIVLVIVTDAIFTVVTTIVGI